MKRGRMQGIAKHLHWWIIGGMVVGAIWGTMLHGAYFEGFQAEAVEKILPGVDDPAQIRAHTKAIQKAVMASLQDTPMGGLAYGLAALFMKLLKMVVIPLVFASLVTGICGMGDFSRLGRIGGRTGLWYVTTSFLAITTGLLMVNLIAPGEGTSLTIAASETTLTTPQSGWDMMLAMVPSNVFSSAANGQLLPVIFFAIFFGIFLLKSTSPGADTVRSFFDGLFEVMMKLTSFVILLAPIGIAALIAKMLSTTGPEIFQTLAGYAGTVAAALAIHFFGTLPLLVWWRTGRNPYRVMRQMSPALLTAFSTASSAGTLPVTLDRIENGVGVSNRISGFVLPLGATVNMDGTALYECVATLFVAQLYAASNPEFVLTMSTQLTIVGLALIVSIGAAGIPHAGLVMMTIIFEAVGLPLYLTGLLWAVDRPLDMCRTATNVWSDTLAAVYVDHVDSQASEAVAS